MNTPLLSASRRAGLLACALFIAAALLAPESPRAGDTDHPRTLDQMVQEARSEQPGACL